MHVGSLCKHSSNVNEVIRVVLKFLFFFYKKILHAQNAQKAQRRNQAKVQNVQKAQKRK